MNAAALSQVSPTAAIPAAGEPRQEGQSSRYGVLVGARRLLLANDGAVRVLDPPPLFRLPGTHRWFHGITNVRGTLIPVYDLAAWLQLPAPDSGRMLLVVGDGESAAGVLVDSSPRHLLVSAAASCLPGQPVPDALAAHSTGTFEVVGETWTALNWTTLFIHLRTQALVAG